MELVENITANGELIAIVVRASFSEAGVNFFTPDVFSQQLAYIHHPAGRVIEPHVHNTVRGEVFNTNEVLVLRKGQLRVDLYDHDRRYLVSRVLQAGDVILLVAGGHGFEVLEEVEMVEVTQGPYAGEQNRTRFSATQL